MFSRSFRELVKGRCREFIREPSAAFFVVLMPLVFMTILGFGLGGTRHERHPVAWVGASEELRAAVAKDPRFVVQHGTDDEAAAALRSGKVEVIARQAGAGVTYVYDPANREAQRARTLLDDVVQTAAGRRDVLQAQDEPVTTPGSRYVDFLVPGLLGLSIMSSSLFGTGMVIVSNRRENLLKRYLATPMRPYEYIISHIVGRGFIFAVEAATILLAARLLFGFTIAGRWSDFLVVAGLGTGAFTALGILLGSRTANVAAMNGMTNLITLPMLILSGVWFSRSNFPDWLAEGVRVLPLTALVDALRRVALEGVGLGSLGFELGILAAFLVVCTVLAQRLFRWY